MARRALVVWIDADAKHCGTCPHWYPSINGFDYLCSVFHQSLDIVGYGAPVRHPDCLKAETFAGG